MVSLSASIKIKSKGSGSLAFRIAKDSSAGATRSWAEAGQENRYSRRVVHHVFEFRHPSWYVDETFHLLECHNATLCLHDKRGSAIFEPFAGPIVYVRFHGTSGLYAGSYPDERLERWATVLAS